MKRILTFICEQAEKRFGFTTEQTFIVIPAVIAGSSLGVIAMGIVFFLSR